MQAGTAAEWVNIVVVIAIALITGLGVIIKQLYELGKKLDIHVLLIEAVDKRVSTNGQELFRIESDAKATTTDHEARLRALERAVKT